MTEGLYRSRAKLSTRLAFVAAGFGVACWAPMVPFAKTRCHLGDDTMGLVLLLLGAGSIVAMPLAANLSGRFSSKPVVLSGGLGLALILPFLSIVSSPIALGIALFAFGASLGSLDVAMNLHAVEVERVSEEPLMSGFHALFSVGGFLGSGVVTALLSRHRTQCKHYSLLHDYCFTRCCGSSAHARESRENEAASLCNPQRCRARHRYLRGHLIPGGGGFARLECAFTSRRTPRLCRARRAGIHALLHRDDVQPLRWRCHRSAIREPLCADSWWVDSASRVVRHHSCTGRMDRAGQFCLCGPRSRKHRTYLVQTRGYATHNAQGIGRCRPHYGRLRGSADGTSRHWLLSKAVGLHNAFWFLAALMACVPIFAKHVTTENSH